MTDILNIGVSALLSFQHSLNTTGHNIGNSDTEGYSRQRTLLTTQTPRLSGMGWLGSGVKVAGVERVYDDFLATQVRSTQSLSSQLELFSDYATRIDNILADPNIGLDSSLQSFFDAMQVLADDPASIPTRQALLSEAGSMVDRFHDLDRQFRDMREQLNQQMDSVTDEINNLADSLGQLNQSIVEALGAASGSEPNDLMDRREVLLNELSQRVDISVVAQDDGAWNVFIGKGQALVMGSSASTLDTRAGVSDVTRREVIFGGSRVITDQLAGGEIGGLIEFRDQILDPGQNQLGLVAVGISDRLNAQHQLGIDLNGTPGRKMFNTPDFSPIASGDNSSAVTLSASYVNIGNLTASDYQLESNGADQYTLTRLSDRKTFAIDTGGSYPYSSAEIDGFSLGISGAATAGDKFLVRPTREAAEQLNLQINDPRSLAAAAPLRVGQAVNADSGAPNQGTALLTQPSVATSSGLPLASPASITLEWRADVDGNGTADDPGFRVTGGPGGSLAFDPLTDSVGKQFTFPGFGDLSFSVSGTPGEGDRFVIENNSNGTGDNRNALEMASLQHSDSLLGETGGIAETANFQEAYGQLVSDVGSRTRHALVNGEATNNLLERHQMSLSSISGVNLDEEAANLIRYQQAYQASAQVISVASTLFDTLIGAVRR